MRFALAAFSTVALATLAGCSDPVPVTADGAFYLQTITDDPTKCMINGNTAQVGAVDGQNRNMVVNDGASADDAGGSLTRVACNVSGTNTFNVHGTLDDTQGATGDYFEMLIGSIAPGASESSPAMGQVIFSAAWTANVPYSGSCNFYFTPSTKETVDNANGAGRVWVTYSCPALTSGMSTCPLKIGYAIFENCLTTPSM